MSPRPTARLSEYAQAVFDDLAGQGIAPTPAEVCRINALCHMVESPARRLSMARGEPVTIGETSLWPLTLRAGDWYQRIGMHTGGPVRRIRALAYAMAHGRDDLPESVPAARRAIDAWAYALPCRQAELTEAVDQVMEADEDMGADPPSTDKTTAGDISAMLASMTHVAPEVWERHCSIPYCAGVIRAWVAQQRADRKAVKQDERMRYERALAVTLSRIRKRHAHGEA